MENTITYLKKRAKKAGVSLTPLVDRLQIPRDAVWRWLKKENIAVQRYRTIIDELEKIENEQK
jgi:transposase